MSLTQTISKALETKGIWVDPDKLIQVVRQPDGYQYIDILGDLEGKGSFSDLTRLKKAFNELRPNLPPGDYGLNANHPTKAKYYQRIFKHDPLIQLSGESAGRRITTKAGESVFKQFPTMTMRVIDTTGKNGKPLAPKTVRQRINAVAKQNGMNSYIDPVSGDLYDNTEGVWRNRTFRNWSRTRASAGQPGSRLNVVLNYEGQKRLNLNFSSLEAKQEAMAKILEIKEYNRVNNFKPGDVGFKRVEHKIRIADPFWKTSKGKELGASGDAFNIVGTTENQWKIKDALEQRLKGHDWVVDVDEITGEIRYTHRSVWDPYKLASQQGDVVEAGADLLKLSGDLKDLSKAGKAFSGITKLSTARMLGLAPFAAGAAKAADVYVAQDSARKFKQNPNIDTGVQAAIDTVGIGDPTPLSGVVGLGWANKGWLDRMLSTPGLAHETYTKPWMENLKQRVREIPARAKAARIQADIDLARKYPKYPQNTDQNSTRVENDHTDKPTETD